MYKRVPFSDFPIEITVVEHGTEYKKVINENKLARCRMCNHGFLINSDTAYVLEGCLDTTPYIRCPACNRRASAFYYTDDENIPNLSVMNKQKRRKKQYVD